MMPKDRSMKSRKLPRATTHTAAVPPANVNNLLRLTAGPTAVPGQNGNAEVVDEEVKRDRLLWEKVNTINFIDDI